MYHDMEYMTVSIIYHTRFSNNALVADVLSDALESKGYGVSIHPISEAQPTDIPASDLYVIGSPTQIGTLPMKVEDFLKNLKIPEGSHYAVYNTYAEPGSKAPGKIIKAMEVLGAKTVSEPLLLGVKDLKGPLEDDWESKVADWSKGL